MRMGVEFVGDNLDYILEDRNDSYTYFHDVGTNQYSEYGNEKQRIS